MGAAARPSPIGAIVDLGLFFIETILPGNSGLVVAHSRPPHDPFCNGILKLAIYVKTEARIPALRALNREVKLVFDRRGIELPLNQIVVHEAKRTRADG